MPRTQLSRVISLALAAATVAGPAATAQSRSPAPPVQGPVGGPMPDLAGLLTPLVPPSTSGASATPAQTVPQGDPLDALVTPLVEDVDLSDMEDMLSPLTGPETPSQSELEALLDPLTGPEAPSQAELEALLGPLTGPEAPSQAELEELLGPLDGSDGAEQQADPLAGLEDFLTPLDGDQALWDMIDDLVPDEDDPRRPTPRDTDYLEYQQAERQQEEERSKGREPVLIRRVRVDPCGDFEVSWGGHKTCHPRERVYWEVGYNDAPPPPPPEDEDEEPEDSDWGLDFGGSGPSGGPAGGTRGPSGSLGGAPGSSPGTPGAPGPAGGPGASPGSNTWGHGGVVASSDGRVVGTFTPRLDSAVRTPQGLLDVRVSLVANPGAPALLTDEWLVTAATAGGVERTTTEVLEPTAGRGTPFQAWRHVMQGDGVQVRFLVPPSPDGAAATTVSIRQTGASPVVFDISDGLW